MCPSQDVSSWWPREFRTAWSAEFAPLALEFFLSLHRDPENVECRLVFPSNSIKCVSNALEFFTTFLTYISNCHRSLIPSEHFKSNFSFKFSSLPSEEKYLNNSYMFLPFGRLNKILTWKNFSDRTGEWLALAGAHSCLVRFTRLVT